MDQVSSPAARRASLVTHLQTALDAGLTYVLRTESTKHPAPDGAEQSPVTAPASPRAVVPGSTPCVPKPTPAVQPDTGTVARPTSPRNPDAGPELGPGKFNDPQLRPATPDNLAPIKTLADLSGFIGACTRCKLCAGRKTLVFGMGNPKAQIMFVGEGPGADEDDQGLPFVGRAGQLLTKMIEAMGLKRDDVYIGNIVKCRPPENRNPEPDEISECIPFVKTQIRIVNPKVIVCLGRIPSQALLDSVVPISKMRGQWREWERIPVMPTFHPAYLLRNPPMKKFSWEDLKQVMAKVKET